MSKGHAVPVLYAAMAEAGYFPVEQLATLRKLGSPLEGHPNVRRLAGIEALQRGDLVFWPGHVGLMLDGRRLLHANAFHMMTAIEPLAETIERFSEKGVVVSAVRRLPMLS